MQSLLLHCARELFKVRSEALQYRLKHKETALEGYLFVESYLVIKHIPFNSRHVKERGKGGSTLTCGAGGVEYWAVVSLQPPGGAVSQEHGCSSAGLCLLWSWCIYNPGVCTCSSAKMVTGDLH